MNVLYITCYADPWLKVAKTLQERHGFKPVYWIGYEDDHSATLVPETFPDCIYQDYYDAWKGIFPSRISDHFSDSHINIDFIKKYAPFELQAIKMMDRMDPDQYSFNFMERQRHYRKIVKHCSTCLEKLKIDMVICDWIPHRLFDYVLYLLCLFNNIKIVYMGHTEFQGRILPLTDLNAISNQILLDYKKILLSAADTSTLRAQLPDDIIQQFNKVQHFYHGIQSDHERNLQFKNRESSGFFPLAKKFIRDMTGNYKSKYFGREGFFRKGIPTYLKQKNQSIEESNYGIIRYAMNKLRANRFKARLKKYYDSLTIQPAADDRYVFFALHYQPEMTTSPSGDIFVDQMLCIDVLYKHLPEDYLIYVKEHAAVFYSHLEGHTSRTKYFYDDLLSYPRVRLVPADYNSAELIMNAQAVATVTGTIGWEAMVLGKPVIVFGLKWYEKYEGVLKITNEETASRIRGFLANFRQDERKLFAYLNALGKNSSLVYSFRGIKGKVNVSEAECVERLVKLVRESIRPGPVQ